MLNRQIMEVNRRHGFQDVKLPGPECQSNVLGVSPQGLGLKLGHMGPQAPVLVVSENRLAL